VCLIIKTYHGTDVASAIRFLNGAGLDTVEAANRKIDGPPGFFLATAHDDAEFFGARRCGTIIEIDFSERALALLETAGMVRQPIPRGPKSPRFVGEEMVFGPDQFDLFNRLRESGEITFSPGSP
jgi:hypothetical protein